MKLNYKAFTLIELIIVIAIVSLVAAAVFVSINPAKRLGDAKDSQRYSDLTAISKAVNLYTADNGSLPIDLSVENLKQGEKIVLCSASASLTCDGQTHNCRVINDGSFLGPYLPQLPVDPDKIDTTDTGYYIIRDTANTISFGACNSYDQGTNLKVAATTKVEPFKGIYRSVGPNSTTSLASGTANAMTISGSDASFASNLPNNIGVGDVIQYDSNNSGTVDSLAFVQARYSSTSYSVVDVNGDAPNETVLADTDWDIFRAYTSLYNAEEGTENIGIDDALENFDTWVDGKDLVAADQQWHIACYGDRADNTNFYVEDWNTSAENYIKIYTPYLASEVGTSQRHSGVWDDTKYRLIATGNHYAMQVREPYVQIIGLQIESANNNSGSGMSFSVGLSGPVHAISNLVTVSADTQWGTSAGIHFGDYTEGYAINNIVYDIVSSYSRPVYGISYAYRSTGAAYNNTVYNLSTAYASGGTAYTVYYPGAGGLYIYNNISQAVADGYDIGGGSNFVEDYNVSDVASDVAGANSVTGNVDFENVGADNFHLAGTDSVARNAGLDMSSDSVYSFSDDIDLDSRPAGNWDIGADEY